MKKRILLILTTIIICLFIGGRIQADTNDHVSMTFIQTLSDDKTSVSIKGISSVKEGYEIVGIQEEGKERITNTTIESTVTENKEYTFTVYYKAIQEEIIKGTIEELHKEFKVNVVDIVKKQSKAQTRSSIPVGETFVAPIPNNEGTVECAFKVLKEAVDGVGGEVQVGSWNGDNRNPNTAIPQTTAGTISIPNSVKGSDNNEYKVVKVGAYAFYKCTSITTTGLESNSTITILDDSVFSGCSSLTTTDLENNDTITTLVGRTFYSCTSLTSTGLERNDKITDLPSSIFEYCLSLKSTGLENNKTITSIDNRAFYWCEGLTSTGLEKNSTITSIGMQAFSDSVRLTTTGLGENNTITSIDRDAFAGCIGLTSTGLEKNIVIKSLAIGVFSRCRGLTTTGLERNNTITILNTGLFAECVSLLTTGLESNTTVTSIRELAFNGCTGLTDIVLPENSNIESIEKDAFKGCTNLNSFVFKSRTIPNLNIASYGEPSASFPIESILYAPLGTSESDIQRLKEYNNECKVIPITKLNIDETTLLDSYQAGDTFQLDNLKLKATYELKDIVDVYDYDVVYDNEKDNFEYNPVTLKAGDNKITGKYLGIPFEFNIHVHDYQLGSDQTHHWYKCSCGDKKEITLHIPSEWIIDKEATHKEVGSHHKECTVCKIVIETCEIPKVSHTFSSTWLSDENNHWQVCECGEVIGKQTHIASQWIIDKDATHQEVGSQHKECTICKKELETIEIPKVAHTFSSTWLMDETNHWLLCECGEIKGKQAHIASQWIVDKEATHKEVGNQHKECTVCKNILETQDIEKKEYTYEVIEGTSYKYEINSQEKAIIRIDGDYSKFKSVIINDIEVDKENYTVREGSTIVELKPEYLNALKVGQYNVKVVFEDKEVETGFTVHGVTLAAPIIKEPTQIIITGDHNITDLFMLLGGLSGVSIIGCVFYQKKNKKEI